LNQVGNEVTGIITAAIDAGTATPVYTAVLGGKVDGNKISRPPNSGWFQRPKIYIFEYMKQILIEIDDELVEKLERVAPPRGRRRSEFVRQAIRQALWELEEQATAEAYRRQPDTETDVWLDASAWESRRKPPIRRQQR
jgi:predicted transcriptional regulator